MTIIQMYSNSTGNFVVHAARRVTGIDFHNTLPTLTHKSPSSLDWAGGAKGRPQGLVGLEEETTSP